MRFPNVPIQRGVDWDRRASQTVNYLLNRLSYIAIDAEGVPSSGQRLLRAKLPIQLTLNASNSIADAGVAATGGSVFDLKVGGSSIGSITFSAGQTTGTVTVATAEIPAMTLFEVIAPSPADATLADVSLALAVAR